MLYAFKKQHKHNKRVAINELDFDKSFHLSLFVKTFFKKYDRRIGFSNKRFIRFLCDFATYYLFL